MLFSGQLADRVFGHRHLRALFIIALVDLYLTNIVDLPMISAGSGGSRDVRGLLAGARRNPGPFSVLLVAVWQLGVKGILIASLVRVCVAFVVTLREYVRDLVRRIDWRRRAAR